MEACACRQQMWRAAMDDDDEEGAAALDEAAAKVSCREVFPHTDPFGSVQHPGSTQPSLPDHVAGLRHNSAQQAITHCPASGVVSSCQQPSIQDRCEASSSADLSLPRLTYFEHLECSR